MNVAKARRRTGSFEICVEKALLKSFELQDQTVNPKISSEILIGRTDVGWLAYVRGKTVTLGKTRQEMGRRQMNWMASSDFRWNMVKRKRA